MSQTVSPQQVVAPPTRALIIQPDNTYQVREIVQNVETYQGIVGGWVEGIPTQYGCFWRDEDGP